MVIHNKDRNQHIVEVIKQLNSCGKTCLVLSDRVEHLYVLQQQVGKEYSRVICGSSKKQDREESLKLLDQRWICNLFATYQLAKEGLDIPSLDCVVFASPKKDQITIIQSSGRVGRKSPGKTVGFVCDIVDSKFWILKRYAAARHALYKRNKYAIFSKNR